MKKALCTLVAALTVAFVAACSGGAASHAVGVYKLDTASLKTAALAEVPADQRKQVEGMLSGMFDQMDVRIDLKADGTTVSTSKGAMGQPDTTESGTWKLDGTQLTVTTKDSAGKEESKTGTLGTGQFTIPFEQEGKKLEVIFKKQ